MRIPPKKPHFFQPILPGFQHHGLLIPKSFFKYLNGLNCESTAVFRRGLKKWSVKVDGRRFGDGWRKFAKDQDLHVGDFIVLRHEGHMVFEVMVFEPSACERQCSPSDHVIQLDDDDDDDDPMEATEASTGTRKTSVNHFDRSVQKKKPFMTRFEADTTTTSTLDLPYFVSTLKQYNVGLKGSAVLNIPMKFARPNGLTGRKCAMILRDEKKRSWEVECVHKTSHVTIRRGWMEFCIANGLKEGDAFKFEIVKNGKIPIVNFQCS